MKNFYSIGFTETTTDSEKEKHKFFLLMGSLMSLGGIMWGSISFYFGLYLPGIIPYGYTVLTLINFIFFYFTKSFRWASGFQVFISMLLPFLFQWSLGGFFSSGIIMIWAMVAIAGAMTFEKLKTTTKWMVVYIIMIVVTAFLDSFFYEKYALNLPFDINTLFFALNIGVVSCVVFGLFFFFKYRLEKSIELEQEKQQILEMREKELQYSHQQVLASEEELRQNSEELLAINDNLEITKQNLESVLESEQKSKKELEIAHHELKEAQMQLMQSEKMSSLGQMTAGIAHEINNPINFVAAGIDSLETVFEELREMIDFAKDLDELPPEELIKRTEKVRQFKSKIDINESLEDFSELIGDIKHGANRTSEIVKGLKVFSRADTGDYIMADVHEGIDSTLMLLRNKMVNIKIIKDYDTYLSQIMCYPGELNQVFMNLISNAVDAMNEVGKLEISTNDFGEKIKITFQDSGSGMPQSVIDKIFDPFFTTKEIGKGTGLGLSISYGIIQKHNGELLVESEEGEGTKFTIILPKNKGEEL